MSKASAMQDLSARALALLGHGMRSGLQVGAPLAARAADAAGRGVRRGAAATARASAQGTGLVLKGSATAAGLAARGASIGLAAGASGASEALRSALAPRPRSPGEARDRARRRAEWRLTLLVGFFALAFTTVGGRMAVLASSDPEEPQAPSLAEPILSTRADITDRQGRLLATNLATYALYAQPADMVDPVHAAEALAAIFPDLDGERLLRDFTGARRFVWVRRQISPEQMQAVHDIGEPGLLFGPREMRLYPNGPVAAHVLGGASYGREDVASAEVIGTAGVERFFDARLRDPAAGPLALSIDLTVQAAMEEVLLGGMTLMNAKGAAGILMDAHTGEIVAMASLPDFDPNDRPPVATSGDPGDSPLFNRAIQGVYELGSVFKIFAVAQALELGLVNPDTMIDTQGPLTWGRFRINDFHSYGPSNSVTDVIAKSSNVGTARIATMIGPERQHEFLDRLGLTTATTIEMPEARSGVPLLPANWSEISMLTISYGHGMSTTSMNLAAAYAAIANGGLAVEPTLVRQDAPPSGERVMSEEVAQQSLDMLREVVTRGTASFINLPTYHVAGKTGSADKPRPSGGYFDDKVIATFAGMFPYEDPQYVIVVTLDEAVETSGPEPRRTAGWTAVPIAAELVRRTAPLLGLRPVEPEAPGGVTLAAN